MARWSRLPVLRRLWIHYEPRPDEQAFLDRAESQQQDGLEVSVAVLDAQESRVFFGVPMARRGVQPVWLRVVNRGNATVRLHIVSIDPDYFSPLEAAAINHFSTGKRLLGFGALAWLFLPLLLLLPIKLLAVRLANRRMDDVFRRGAFRLRAIPPGARSEGFVFTPRDVGSKDIRVRLMGPEGDREFAFTIAIPGLDADHLTSVGDIDFRREQVVECDVPEFLKRLSSFPRATTNAKGTREGDPVNLVVIGEFVTVLSAFASRWDETETISVASCWRTLKAFLLGMEYRYSPVSSLYLFGRRQDFALQRVRESINERLHLRLWLTPLRFRGLPVWVGQISRDIGVRFSWRTWNLTTHRIDPDVDEARDYVVQDLLEARRLEAATHVGGVGACTEAEPRRNLTGDPYFTDGQRAAMIVATSRTTPRYLSWA